MRCWKRSVEEDQVNNTTEQWSQLAVAGVVVAVWRVFSHRVSLVSVDHRFS